jgi:hypothetical protein
LCFGGSRGWPYGTADRRIQSIPTARMSHAKGHAGRTVSQR